MPQVKDYYKILGVGERATADEIKRRYRKLAREYHPDRNPDRPDAEERFKEIQEAYDVLSDSGKRKQYDMMRKNPFGKFANGFDTNSGGRYYRAPDGSYVRFEQPGSGATGAGDFGDIFGGGLGSLGDIFSRIFSGGASAQEPPERTRQAGGSGLDIRTSLQLTFEQALRGGRTEVTLPGGEKVRIRIPKGVRSGFKIRVRGHGKKGPGQKRGDLYVSFEVEPHPQFRRERDDLYMKVTVSALEALLGTTRSITTAYGDRIKVNITPGTQPGDKLRLKGQGVETDKGRGDLYVEIEVRVPRLSTSQQEVMRNAARKAGLID